MRNILLIILFVFVSSMIVSAKNFSDAILFFNRYIKFANSYDTELLDMYNPDAKIIREVVKPNGETVKVIIPTKRYLKELKIGQKTAKLRKYQNKYRNVKVKETSDGIKISAERQPTKETYWLKMYQIVEPTNSGLKIKEEMMQTKVQMFLNQKDKD